MCIRDSTREGSRHDHHSFNGEGSQRRLPIPAALVTGDASLCRREKSESMNTLAHISLKRRIPLQLGSEGSRKSDEDPMTEGAVYERIKNWLLAQTLVPGQLLQIGEHTDLQQLTGHQGLRQEPVLDAFVDGTFCHGVLVALPGT